MDEGEDLSGEMASGREQMWEVEGMYAEVSVGKGRLHLECLTWPTGAFFLTPVKSCLFSKFSNWEITSAGARKIVDFSLLVALLHTSAIATGLKPNLLTICIRSHYS